MVILITLFLLVKAWGVLVLVDIGIWKLSPKVVEQKGFRMFMEEESIAEKEA